MDKLKAANMVLSFIIEVVILLAFGYWGFREFHGFAAWLFGLGVPAAAIIIWGIWAAPKSNKRLKQPGLVILKLVLFGLAGLALLAAGQTVWALILWALAILNQAAEYYTDIHHRRLS
jgi:hypothetical protein